MPSIRRRFPILGLVVMIAVLLALASPSLAATSGFNDEYVFATTKSVSDLDMNPALKATLFPVTVVLDTVFLPFALIVGLFA